MQWYEVFNKENEPSSSEVRDYIGTPLWDDLTNYIEQTFSVKAKLAFSGCSMDKGLWKGWNVKFKKRGKSLCTLYPKQGYFLALVQVGLNNLDEADALMPLCSEYTQNLFKQSQIGPVGKFLAFEINSESILQDMKRLIELRG
jgi:AraC family transcriptional regulator